jgi:hypothetical protein
VCGEGQREKEREKEREREACVVCHAFKKKAARETQINALQLIYEWST